MKITRNEILENTILKRIDDSMRDDTRKQPSVSGVIYCLTKSYYQNVLFQENEETKQQLKHTKEQTLLFITGLGFESVLLGKEQQSEAGELDGIQWHLDHFGDDGDLHEIKSTRQSSKKSEDISEGWLKQIKSYCKVKNVTSADLSILHLMGNYCLAPQTLVLTSNLEWVTLDSLKVGDKLVGVDEFGNYYQRRGMRESTVESFGAVNLPTYKITMADGTVLTCSDKHLWLGMRLKSSNGMDWIETSDLRVGMRIRKFGNTWKRENSRDIGWLAGILDGEGSVDNKQHGLRVSIAQNDGPVLDKTLELLDLLDIDGTVSPNNFNNCLNWRTKDLYESMRLLGIVNPLRLNKPSAWEGLGMGKTNSFNEIVGIEFIGNTNLIAIGTSTKTLMADGYVSHNSPPFPDLICWHLEFTQDEIDDNWNWIKDRAGIYLDHVARQEVPTPFKYNMEWECNYCQFKGLCQAKTTLAQFSSRVI